MSTPAVPLVELYTDPVLAEQGTATVWKYDGDIMQSLAKTGKLATLNTREAILGHLQALPEFDYYDLRERATHILGVLPVATQLREYGEAVAAWNYANTSDFRVTRQLDEQFAQEGYDPSLLQKTKGLAYMEHVPARGTDLLKQYRLAESILGKRPDELDLPALLQESAVTSEPLSAKRIDDYELIPVRSNPNSKNPDGRVVDWKYQDEVVKPGLEYNVWLDVPAGLLLTYKKVPQLLLGMVIGKQDELQLRTMHRQVGKKYDPSAPHPDITGVRQPRGLRPLDWERFAGRVTEELAVWLDKTHIGIIAGRSVTGQQVHWSNSEVAPFYDEAAERLQFVREVAGDDWIRPAGESWPAPSTPELHRQL